MTENQMAGDTRGMILAAARDIAQAHGYAGITFRDLAAGIGIKAASIHHHFPAKADLGAAVAKRYWEDTRDELEALKTKMPSAVDRLRFYPEIFRRSLQNGNRICLCSFMAAEYDDLPVKVKDEIKIFAEVNVNWLKNSLIEARAVDAAASEGRARAIFAAVSGAQLLARSQADVDRFDELILQFHIVGLIPS